MSCEKNVQIYITYNNHDDLNKFNECKINTEGSLTRIWCSIHNRPEHSCVYSNKNSKHNATCYKCCSEDNNIVTQIEMKTKR